MKAAIFHANAGYGHRKIAEIILQEFRDRGFGENSVTLEDALDSTPCFFRKSYPAIYFNSVKYTPGIWGWNYEWLDKPGPARFIRPLRTAGNRLVGAALLKRMIREQPDFIICTHFLSAELFSRAKREGKLRSKIVVVITDFYPHSFWVNEGTDLYWVMSTEGARDLEERGVDPSKIHAGGIPVSRAFLPQGRKAEMREKHGLDPSRFTLLVTSGSFGLGPTEEILREMEAFSDKIQAFVVCGNNRALEARLKERSFGYPIRIFGFIDFMPELMEAGDLMLAKSGGSTTCESLVKGLPMVVMSPIPGQETRNAYLLKERDAAFFLHEPRQIRTILKTVFSYPEIMAEKKRAIQSLARPHAASDLVSYIMNHCAGAS